MFGGHDFLYTNKFINFKRELDKIFQKSEELSLRAKIEKLDKERDLYEMSQFIFDLFNLDIQSFGFMKNYQNNLSNALGIKVGIIKEQFINPYDKFIFLSFSKK